MYKDKLVQVAKNAKPTSLAALKQAQETNVYAISTRKHPNAEKLEAGALQRNAVQPHREHLALSKNVEKIGVYKREELNERACEGLHGVTNIWSHRRAAIERVARIYMPTMKQTQCHPAEKNVMNHWVIESDSKNAHISPMIERGHASEDLRSRPKYKVHSLEDAVGICERYGWGYDIIYPNKRYHTRKSYADNFSWRGEPKKEPQYD